MRRHGRSIRFIGCAVLALLLAGATLPGPTTANGGPWVITESTTLSEDHYGNILIQGSDIALDCAGHRVLGPGSNDSSGGIEVASDRVTVKNCTVTGFVHNGLYGHDGDGIRLEANTFVGNGNHGVHLDYVTNATVSGNASRLNGTVDPAIGIVLTRSASVEISQNVVSGNPWAGIALLDGTTGSTVSGNTALRDGLGFLLHEADGNTLLGNTANQNDHGFTVMGSSANVLTDNTANRNRFQGFSLHTGCSGNTLAANTANGNQDGYNVNDCDGNRLTGNEANANANIGFLVWGGSTTNTLSYNTGLNNAATDAIDAGTGNSWAENTFRTWYGF